MLWSRRAELFARLALAVAVVATVVWSFVLLGWSPEWYPALRWVVLIGGLVAAVAIAALPRLAGRARRRHRRAGDRRRAGRSGGLLARHGVDPPLGRDPVGRTDRGGGFGGPGGVRPGWLGGFGGRRLRRRIRRRVQAPPARCVPGGGPPGASRWRRRPAGSPGSRFPGAAGFGGGFARPAGSAGVPAAGC